MDVYDFIYIVQPLCYVLLAIILFSFSRFAVKSAILKEGFSVYYFYAIGIAICIGISWYIAQLHYNRNPTFTQYARLIVTFTLPTILGIFWGNADAKSLPKK